MASHDPIDTAILFLFILVVTLVVFQLLYLTLTLLKAYACLRNWTEVSREKRTYE